jgi:hypothetical protein
MPSPHPSTWRLVAAPPTLELSVDRSPTFLKAETVNTWCKAVAASLPLKRKKERAFGGAAQNALSVLEAERSPPM